MKRLLSACLVALTACHDDPPYIGEFETPIASGVLDSEVGSPFEEPIGYVANAGDGQIITLALKQGRFLTATPDGSFVPSRPVPTGAMRRLASVSPWTDGAGRIEVFAADIAYGVVVRVPHTTAVDADGVPVLVDPTASEPRFFGTGSPTLADLQVEPGYTTTETWTVAYDGARWWVTGSRSGRQEHQAVSGTRYTADRQRISFLVSGDAVAGDRFEIDTDGGLTEIDVGGIPMKVLTAPDQSIVAVVVTNPDSGFGELRWIDPSTGTVVPGPAAAIGDVGGIEWSFGTTTLYVADRLGRLDGQGQALAIDPTLGTVTTIPLPWPVDDVAVLEDADHRWLYAVPHHTSRVEVLDLDTGELIDGNAWVDGHQPLDLHAPITGIEAIPVAYRWPETIDGINRHGRSVAVSLATGRLVFVEEGTACLVRDEAGPRPQGDNDFTYGDWDADFDGVEPGYGPDLVQSAADERAFQVNPCGGAARQEAWSLHYDTNRQGWEVEGSVSGIQDAIAREDERYVSDDGAISFLIRSGSLPTQDGWSISLVVNDGVLTVTGDNDADGLRDIPLDAPTEPVFFHYRVGLGMDAWQTVDDRPFVLVAGSATDHVGRIEPGTGDVEVDWQ